MIRWVLYDDPGARSLRPLTRLRPASGLLLGAATIEARWRGLAGGEDVRVVCRRSLAPLAEGRVTWDQAFVLGSRAKIAAGGLAGSAAETGFWDDDARWVSDLLVPDDALWARFRGMAADSVASMDGQVVGWRSGPKTRSLLEDAGFGSVDEGWCGGSPAETGGPLGEIERALGEGDRSSGTVEGFLQMLGQGAPTKVELDGTRLKGLGDLIRHQDRVLVQDLTRILGRTKATGFGDGFAYEADALRVGHGCRVDHGAVLDARHGPIVLEEGCEVFPHTWIRGPFYAGAGCRLLGGRIGGGSSFGPQCRVRGEVEASVFLGFDNKAHDGFIGHSYLGEWVNLGAFTTTSDLKNNYSAITLVRENGREETGLTKLGVFLGDHVKTRIGCLLTCGTVVGLGASLIGEPAVTERWVPDFSWGVGKGSKEYEINKFLQTAEIVLGRRGLSLTPAMAEALREAHQMCRPAQSGRSAIRT